MRFVRVLFVILLLFSLGLNAILYAKWNRKRALFTVNGEAVSKKDIDDFLQQQAGPNAEALMTQRIMVEQEAKKQGVAPSSQEIDEAFLELKETRWEYARALEGNPWKEDQARADVNQAIAKNRLRFKDVKITDDEIREEYNTRAQIYDTPNKARTELAIVLDVEKVKEVKQLLEKHISPAVIMQNSGGRVVFIGYQSTFTFLQPFGNQTINRQIFAMKPDAVTVLPPQQFEQMGAKALVVRMKEIVPGKKADLNDPHTKEKIRNILAEKRAMPWSEYLSKLWANTKFEGDDPSIKRRIEMVLFPDRFRTQR